MFPVYQQNCIGHTFSNFKHLKALETEGAVKRSHGKFRNFLQ